ncbi:unnamed protein product [Aphanomyces euteiches]|uniref:Uncharacterized protein n=1 Tax=Aphanomyces euteiches TaxID=100861 RepID=A0A6G0WKW0_9STRA|nr:hypothetical protein Ae201684_014161 [Aphanomyces euteiches]KAH9096271.1 hypothetical protein Ae201684P_009505 [Aphanomyces euteiches]
MKYESAAPRYDFRFLGNGNVEVQMPHPNRKGYGMQVVFLALCIFGGLCLVYSMYPYLEPFIPLLLLDSLMTVAICASIADAMFGFELIEVTNASFSHTRNYGCRKKTKHYDITQMGPLKAHVSQMYDSDDSSRVVGTRTQLGFDYGGRTIYIGECFLETEIALFVNHVRPYLPDRIKQPLQGEPTPLQICA